jgi:hypothetical protein
MRNDLSKFGNGGSVDSTTRADCYSFRNVLQSIDDLGRLEPEIPFQPRMEEGASIQYVRYIQHFMRSEQVA